MDQIEEVKGKIEIVELISEYTPLKRAGRNFKGLCPFHGEKTPSFMVNPELQIFKCFGCGEGGDAISFLQKIEGMEFGEALKNLAKRVGVELTSYRPTRGEEEKERLIKICNTAADAYHFLLTKHEYGKPALEYLKNRGITDESIEKFRMGYAPRGWDFAIKFLVGKKGFTLVDLNKTGLVVEGKTYDRFRDRVMFPLNNHRGQTVGFAGRVMPGADEKAGGKYINTPETEIYHKGEMLFAFDMVRAEIKQKQQVVVVEGEIDAIASYQAGIKNVVAIKGSALTEKQVELMSRVADTIVLALDADMAGDAAARRGIEIAEGRGMTVKVARWTEGKDPGELAISHPDIWVKAVEEAIMIYDFYLESAIKRYGLEVEGKKKIGRELLPIWVKIPDEIVKAHYVQKLAAKLGVNEEDIRSQMRKLGTGAGGGNEVKMEAVQKLEEAKNVVRANREEKVVQLGLYQGRMAELFSPAIIKLFENEFWKRVLGEMGKSEEKDVMTIIRNLPAELKTKVEELLTDPMLEEEGEEKDWQNAVKRLELEEVLESMAEGGKDQEEIKVLAKRKNELTRGR